MFWPPRLRVTTNFDSLPFNVRQKIKAIVIAEAQSEPANYFEEINNKTVIEHTLTQKGNRAPNGEPCNY